MEIIARIFDTINILLRTIFVPLVGSVELFAMLYIFFVKWLPSWINKKGFFRGLYIGFITLFTNLIWLKPQPTAALTPGVNFSRVAGPTAVLPNHVYDYLK